MDIFSPSDMATTIVLSATQSYTVSFNTTNAPISLDLRMGTGATTTRAIRYRDLKLPSNVPAQLTITPQRVDVLRYDQDRDGFFESSVTPTVDVSGTLANDQEPPTISISRTAQQRSILVTLDAQDNSAGVRAIFYSLDGTNFHLYNGPLTLDPDRTPAIYAFADDRAGNRSGLFRTAVKVSNAAPIVGTIRAPGDPIKVNTAVNVSADLSDPNIRDTHTATWDWGDGNTTAGTVIEMSGTGSLRGSHVYTAAGVYTVRVTVTDQDGASGQGMFRYAVVYDPDAGFVIGGGWMTSPLGAYPHNSSLTGKASFGFYVDYLKGSPRPIGETLFTFSPAKLDFHSISYQWLVITGSKAQYKGSGIINGRGNYGFLVTISDGQINGKQKVDTFRIKIWDKATGVIVYDNQIGAADDADATTAITGGSITVHAR